MSDCCKPYIVPKGEKGDTGSAGNTGLTGANATSFGGTQVIHSNTISEGSAIIPTQTLSTTLYTGCPAVFPSGTYRDYHAPVDSFTGSNYTVVAGELSNDGDQLQVRATFQRAENSIDNVASVTLYFAGSPITYRILEKDPCFNATKWNKDFIVTISRISKSKVAVVGKLTVLQGIDSTLPAPSEPVEEKQDNILYSGGDYLFRTSISSLDLDTTGYDISFKHEAYITGGPTYNRVGPSYFRNMTIKKIPII